ncbi:hypothetical protein JI435_125620 [Parastagonospora nodorum SN15]|uniref:Uncharacterized protein n=1 Tax=Phaeosphaeria nodorum (strain SN15 / ATCC MYA-4574 / FGSC 10173) TaxID=321614 RepID=A0A7U2IC25_PHANO|nr:hypothetical protein JI435_125620 [Parastagonospora nodorum SN15]
MHDPARVQRIPGPIPKPGTISLRSTYILAAGACGAIIFTAVVQWKALTTSFQVRRLEIVESVLATGLFIWLNFSWAIGTPERPFGHINLKRLIFSGLGVVVLFYGPLAHADAAWKDDERSKDLDFEGDGRTVYTDAPEKAPLELVRN